MEPERKIEKLLRAFAKKRRDAAGAPLDLHPATRRLLQGEVARRAPGQREGNFFLKVFGGRRPGFVYAVCVAAVVCICAAVLLPVLNQRERKIQLAEANRTEMSRRSDQPAAPPPSAMPATVSVATNGMAFIFPSAGGAKDKSLNPGMEPVLAEKLESQKSGLPGEAVKETNLMGRPFSDLAFATAKSGGEQKQGGGGAPLSLNAPAVQAKSGVNSDAVVGGRGGFGGGGRGGVAMKDGQSNFMSDTERAKAANSVSTVSQRFVQADVSSGLQSRARVSSAPGAVSSILDAFQFEQNGRDIQIVDGDGSVYNGYVQTEEETKAQAVNAQKAPAGQLAQQAELPAKNLQNNQAVSQSAAQNYFFRVAGTNRSLNQNVIFTGNFVAIGNDATWNVATNTALSNQVDSRYAPANQRQQSSLLNSRISGTAVIDNRKEIQINAVPVVP